MGRQAVFQGLQGRDIDHSILAAADAEHRYVEPAQTRVQCPPLGRRADLLQGRFDEGALGAVETDGVCHLLVGHRQWIEVDQARGAFDTGTVIVDKRVVTGIQGTDEVVFDKAQSQGSDQRQSGYPLWPFDGMHPGYGAAHGMTDQGELLEIKRLDKPIKARRLGFNVIVLAREARRFTPARKVGNDQVKVCAEVCGEAGPNVLAGSKPMDEQQARAVFFSPS
jgi:hypothetical protein